jgi:acetylornithine deacetylase/succinyl-diaminopimelate desuccinylase-like protein
VTDEQVLTAVGAEQAWMEDLLVRLVEAPTTLGDEDPGQAVMAAAFADCGLQPVDVPLDADALRAAEGSSPFSWEVAGKRDVVATWEPAERDPASRSLILNGHVDVVPPAAAHLWSSPPFTARRDGHWLYGRGAGDMKAGLVAMTGAVRALRGLGLELGAPVQLQSVVEEECTGNGALMTLLAGHTADACVITEPHPDHITIAQVGVVWFHVDVEDTVARAAANDPRVSGGSARVRYDGFACEGSIVPRDEPVVVALSRAYEGLHGVKPDLVPTTATTDARHFVRHGVPAICFGPRGERIHGIDERVSLQSMLETAQVLALFVRDWSGVQEEEHTRENTDVVTGS